MTALKSFFVSAPACSSFQHYSCTLHRAASTAADMNTLKGFFRPALYHGSGIKKFVGKDKLGNQYYLWQEMKSEPVKRMVEYPSNPPTPELVPAPWNQWLRNQRKDPPTDKELDEFERKKAAFQQRVKELEAADAKLRLQELAERRLKTEDMSAQAFIAAVSGAGGVGGAGSSGAAAESAGSRGAGSASSSGAGASGDTGYRPKPAQTPEGSGSGSDFKPGVWRPGGKS